MQAAIVDWELSNDRVSVKFSQDLEDLCARSRMALLNEIILCIADEIKTISDETPAGKADDTEWYFPKAD